MGKKKIKFSGKAMQKLSYIFRINFKLEVIRDIIFLNEMKICLEKPPTFGDNVEF
jgi:hypothetical protein